MLVRVSDASDVKPSDLRYVRADGKDLVVANVGGKFYAMDNWCTHEQGNLSMGELKEGVLTCPDQVAKFDVKTGRVMAGPEGEPPDSISAGNTYKVVIQGNDVMVEIP